MSANYNVEIIEASGELSKKQRVQLKTNSGEKLDELAPIVIDNIAGYAKLKIDNPNVKSNPTYEHFVIYTDEGNMFYTGSPTFMQAFMSIWDEMAGEKDWGIEVFKRDSRNYAGKQFLTCRLV